MKYSTFSRHRRSAGAVLAVSAAALVAAGCSSSEDSGSDHAGMTGMSHASSAAPGSPTSQSPGAAAHNAADVRFNRMMIPHHQQALAMAELVGSRTENPQVRTLATQIKDAQQPEIDQMTQRLAAWGESTGSEGSGASGGMSGEMSGDMGGGMNHSGMPGMMSDAEMTAMRDARGAEFDRLWLEGMIRHHEGAIAMANEELASGIDPESRTLATKVRDTQQREIDEMKRLLAQ
ncbi:DUF305 domain-containing protein [Gordonia sinesedis]